MRRTHIALVIALTVLHPARALAEDSPRAQAEKAAAQERAKAQAVQDIAPDPRKDNVRG